MGMSRVSFPMDINHDIILVDLHLHFFPDFKVLWARWRMRSSVPPRSLHRHQIRLHLGNDAADLHVGLFAVRPSRAVFPPLVGQRIGRQHQEA